MSRNDDSRGDIPVMTRCPICHGHGASFRKLYDDRHAYPGYFDLFRCGDCRHKYLQVGFDPDELSRLYTHYYPRSSFDVDRHEPHRENRGLISWLNGADSFAFRWVPRNVRILDIGCGFGETLGYHRSRGCDVYGVEADENIRRVAEKFGYKVHVGLFDPTVYETGFFDYVTMDQVIEHLADPVGTLRDVAGILKPAGHLIIATPNSNGWGAALFGKRWISWHVPYHLHLFSEASMRLAAVSAGYEVSSARTITSSFWLHLQWCHLLTCPEMGNPSPLWSPQASAGAWTRIMLAFTGLFGLSGMNQALSRIFDALGLGDNYLFVLRKI